MVRILQQSVRRWKQTPHTPQSGVDPTHPSIKGAGIQEEHGYIQGCISHTPTWCGPLTPTPTPTWCGPLTPTPTSTWCGPLTPAMEASLLLAGFGGVVPSLRGRSGAGAGAGSTWLPGAGLLVALHRELGLGQGPGVRPYGHNPMSTPAPSPRSTTSRPPCMSHCIITSSSSP